MRTIDRRCVGALFSASLVVAPACWASEGSSLGVGDDPVAERADGPTTDDADVLAGPPAREADVPGAGTPFAPSMDGAGGVGGRTNNTDARTDRWLQRVIEGLVRRPPSPELAIAGERLEAIQRYLREHDERLRAYRRAHQEETRELRAILGIEEGQRPRQRDAQNLSPEAEAAVQRLREISRLAPTSDRVRGEIWSVLTDAQRAYITSELERLRAEADARDARDAMGMSSPGMGVPGMGVPGMGDGAADEPVRTGPTGDPRLDAFVERVMALPADRRERLLSRLEGMMDRYDEQDRENRRRAQPPTMDGVEVPSGDEPPRRRRDRDRRGDRDA